MKEVKRGAKKESCPAKDCVEIQQLLIKKGKGKGEERGKGQDKEKNKDDEKVNNFVSC